MELSSDTFFVRMKNGNLANDLVSTNHFNLASHSGRRDNLHDLDQAGMTSGTTFFLVRAKSYAHNNTQLLIVEFGTSSKLITFVI